MSHSSYITDTKFALSLPEKPPACPLCKTAGPTLFFKDKKRQYLCCPNCSLVFVPKEYWLTQEEQKAVYDLHENHAEDEGYRRFLSRLTRPLLNRLEPGQKGLDFGCGPGPALAAILNEKGHHTDCFDPFYFNTPKLLKKNYDFITATEVVEHLEDPAHTFELLFNRLNPKGWLGIMTKMVIDREAFKTWHYIRDLTHICFYRQDTFRYLANRFDTPVFFFENDVILFHKI